MLGSEYDMKMYVRNQGYPLPVKIGAQNRLFSTTLQLNGKFDSMYMYVTKHGIDNRANAFKTTVFYVVSEFHEIWSTHRSKLDRHFTYIYIHHSTLERRRERDRKSFK